MRFLVKKSKYALYVTDEYLQDKYPNKAYCVSCSNVDLFPSSEEILSNRNSKIDNLMVDERVDVGMIGGLGSSYKGFDVAIDSIALLVDKYPNLYFSIVGSGNSDKWEKYARKKNVYNHVKFLGSIESGSKILNWLDSIDVYIQPSKTEGLPRATIEAMSRGCPVVGSDAGGIPELIDVKYVHKKGSHRELAKMIDKLLSNKYEMRVQSKNNFEKSHDFSMEILKRRRDLFWSHVREEINSSNIKSNSH